MGSLSLHGNALTSVPLVLTAAAAPELSTLVLSGNWELALGTEDVERLLALPALSIVYMGETATGEGVMDHLESELQERGGAGVEW